MILNEVSVVDALHRWPRRRMAPSLLALVVDVALVVLSIYLAWQLRATLPWFDDANDVDVIAKTAIAPMAGLWIVLLGLCSAYSPTAMGAGTAEYRRVVLASAITAGSIGVGCYLLRFPLSRGLFFLTFVLGIPLLVLGRHLVRRGIHRLHEHRILTQKVLLVGGTEQVAEVAKVLHRERWLGYEIIGAAVPPHRVEDRRVGDVPILGSAPRVHALAHEWAPDIVMFAGGAVNSAAEMRRAAWGLEESGTRIMIVPSLTDVASDRITVRPAAGLPMMELEGPRSRVRAHTLKRAFDVVGASILLVLLSPALACTALAVKLHDRGPVLYRQVRAGRQGLPFSCYKFRSMVVGADTAVTTIQNDHHDGHVLFKAKDDPRITRPGRFIRRFSIDELPQLVNVVQGSMSLVGPARRCSPRSRDTPPMSTGGWLCDRG